MSAAHRGRLRNRVAVLALGLLSGTRLAAAATPDVPVPPAVLACTHEQDVLKRLACFDREVGRYAHPVEPAAAPARAEPEPAEARTAVSPAPAEAHVPVSPAPAQAPKPGIRSRLTAITGEGAASRSAHIASLETGSSGLLVIHLDNGETWEQLQGIAGDRGLRSGDAVQLEKHLGAWYLSGPHLSNMHVREK